MFKKHIRPDLKPKQMNFYTKAVTSSEKQELPRSKGDYYDGAELKPFDGRPGAMDAFKLPSRGLT